MKNLQEYKQEMESLQFSAGQKAALSRRIIKAAGEGRAPRHAPHLRPALAAVLAVAVLTAAAGATGLLKNVGEVFSGVFGSVCPTEIVDRIGEPVGASATDGGYTVTADAVLGDCYNLALVFSVGRADGGPFPVEVNEDGQPFYFGERFIDLGNYGGSHGSTQVRDLDPEDNTLQVIEMISFDKPIAGHKVSAHFKDLLPMAGGEPFAKGTWDLKFRLNYEDLSVTLPVGRDFTNDGTDFTLDRITVSPLGYRVEYRAKEEIPWEQEDGSAAGFSTGGQLPASLNEILDRYLYSIPLTIERKDGTVLDCTASGGSLGDDGHGVRSSIFPELIDLDTVESITFGGVEVPLG